MAKHISGVLQEVRQLCDTRAHFRHWIIGRFGAFDSYSGVTTNQSEGFKTVMKVPINILLAI